MGRPAMICDHRAAVHPGVLQRPSGTDWIGVVNDSWRILMVMAALGLGPEHVRPASLEREGSAPPPSTAAKPNAFAEPSSNAVALLTNTPTLQNSNAPAAGKA